MPKAWKAGLPWVDLEQDRRELLEDLEADRTEQRARTTATAAAVRGLGQQPNIAKKSSMLAPRPSTIVSSATSQLELARRGRASRARPSEKPATKPATATETSRMTPISASVTRSRSLPNTKFGCSFVGTSKTTIRASRMPDSQPSPE